MAKDDLPGDTPPNGSVTEWIAGVQNQDSMAQQQLWERYYFRLLEYARHKLKGSRRVADEEDVVLSALHSFYDAAQAQRFPQLSDREDLWRILLSLTMRKAIDADRHAGRAVRGGGNVRGESCFGTTEGPAAGLDWLSGSEPTPELAASWTEEFERLLQALDDDRLRQVALAKLEGLTNPEIAERLACAERTVVRCLTLIRTIWQSPACSS